MGRKSRVADAAIAALGGGPPLPVPETLSDMGPILARWPMMLRYRPDTGELWSRYAMEAPDFHSMLPSQYVETRMGEHQNMIRIDGFFVSAGRVVWLLHHGAWPVGKLGRHDGDPFNDRIENLYDKGEGTSEERPPRRFRPVGVSRLKGRWQAYVDFPDGRRKYLGRRHMTEAAALAARKAWDDAHDLV